MFNITLQRWITAAIDLLLTGARHNGVNFRFSARENLKVAAVQLPNHNFTVLLFETSIEVSSLQKRIVSRQKLIIFM